MAMYLCCILVQYRRVMTGRSRHDGHESMVQRTEVLLVETTGSVSCMLFRRGHLIMLICYWFITLYYPSIASCRQIALPKTEIFWEGGV